MINIIFGVAEFGHELCLSTFCRDVAMLRLYATSLCNAASGHTRKF
ncbi:hypothetical protein [Fischerella thermalis]|nr:hypothetical protein [Fischerella thermalis]